MEKYVEGRQLAENEFLVKVRDNGPNVPKTGFMTRLNKNGTIPKPFLDWNKNKYTNKLASNDTDDIFVIKEDYSSGWKSYAFRIGESQSWATMIHPEGFTVEIYLYNFFELLDNSILTYGELQGEFKWEGRKLLAIDYD